MARHSAVLSLGGSLTDGDHIGDFPLVVTRVAAFGVAHMSSGPQMHRQLFLQHAARLNEEAAIDRFVRYLHVLVGRELLLQPAGDLFRRPLQREFLRHTPS